VSVDTTDRDAIMRARQKGQVRELKRLHAADRALVEERDELAEVRESLQQAEREIGRLRAEQKRCAPLASDTSGPAKRRKPDPAEAASGRTSVRAYAEDEVARP